MLTLLAQTADSDEGGSGLIEVVPGLMIWTLICFGIAFFVLRKYAFGPIQKTIDDRRERIRQAVEELFDVKVVSVNVTRVQPKPKRRGVHRGVRPGWKKAIVELREGDKIEIFEGAGAV